ncbi:MAG: hypothetical protein AB7S53_11705 [Thiomonas sp.]
MRKNDLSRASSRCHLKRVLFCAVAAAAPALIGACAAQQQVTTIQRESTQTFAPTTLVEVLQQLPSRPFVRIAVLDARAAAGTPIAQLLPQLQAKAAAMGANAIVVEDLSTKEGGAVQYNPSGGQFTTTASTVLPHLRAIAIRMETEVHDDGH